MPAPEQPTKLEPEFQSIDFEKEPYHEFHPNPLEPGVNIINQLKEEEYQPNSKSIEMDWDSDELWEKRFLRIVMDEKKERQQELQLMEQKMQELQEKEQQMAQMKQSIRQQINDLKAKTAQMELLIPLAKQFQAMKVDVTTFIPWTEIVQEYSINHNTDLTTAAFDIKKILEAVRDLETARSVTRKEEDRLYALGKVIRQKEAAIHMLMKLQAMGNTKKDIAELVKLVNSWDGNNGGTFRKLDTELIDVGTQVKNGNLQQPNNHQPNGSSHPTHLTQGNGNNSHSFSMNNYLRLQLLQACTSNILNKMGVKN